MMSNSFNAFERHKREFCIIIDEISHQYFSFHVSWYGMVWTVHLQRVIYTNVTDKKDYPHIIIDSIPGRIFLNGSENGEVKGTEGSGTLKGGRKHNNNVT